MVEGIGTHLRLLICDAVDSEPSLHVIDQTKVFASLLDADDIYFKSIWGITLKKKSKHSIV